VQCALALHLAARRSMVPDDLSMDQTRRLIDDRAVSPSTYQHVIAWSEEHHTSIAKIASGAAPGFSIADANLAKAWLLVSDSWTTHCRFGLVY